MGLIREAMGGFDVDEWDEHRLGKECRGHTTMSSSVSLMTMPKACVNFGADVNQTVLT